MGNIFSTTSLLLATWVLYSGQNPFLGFHDGKFTFADGEFTIQFLIGGYHDVDPSVHLHKFEKCRAQLVLARRGADFHPMGRRRNV
jgi:hypothetical protein